MERVGVYLYGFIPGGSPLDLDDLAGVEGAGVVRVANLGLGGASAVVGEVSVDAFEAAMAEGPDPAWLIPRALGHERVLGAILARSAVLPARFGSLFSSNEALVDLVAGHLGAIGDYFARVGDRREWSLRGYLDSESATGRVLETDPALVRRVAELPDSPGARYFREKKLREEARIVARRAAGAEASAIRQAIREVAGDVRSLPLRAPEAPGREMVLHEAALIARGREPQALAAAGRASEAAGGLLTLEPSGPWPPFHFCPDLSEIPT